jgi:hypothetical protein
MDQVEMLEHRLRIREEIAQREAVTEEIARLEEKERLALSAAEAAEVEERWAVAAFWHLQARDFGARADAIIRTESVFGPLTLEDM